MHLDLHGKSGQEARLMLWSALKRCQSQHFTKIVVVHGRGLHSDALHGPVLKEVVIDILTTEFNSQIQKWRPGLPSEGGDGVTVVYLRVTE